MLQHKETADQQPLMTCNLDADITCHDVRHARFVFATVFATASSPSIWHDHRISKLHSRVAANQQECSWMQPSELSNSWQGGKRSIGTTCAKMSCRPWRRVQTTKAQWQTVARSIWQPMPARLAVCLCLTDVAAGTLQIRTCRRSQHNNGKQRRTGPGAWSP